MRAVESGSAPIDDAFRHAMDECVQCRGCEAACPSVSAVRSPDGRTPAPRSKTTGGRRGLRRIPEWIAYRWVLPYPTVLRALTWVMLVAQRLRLVPRRFGVPHLTRGSLRPLDVPVGGEPDAWLYTGCVMDAWLRDTHRSTARSCARPAPVSRNQAQVVGAAARFTSTRVASTRRGVSLAV